MADRLTPDTRRELADLARRYGEPIRVRSRLRGTLFDPLTRSDRYGEVAMVIRRPSGRLLLSTKDFYPPGAFRLPTGGISHGEGVLYALLREAHEETGLDVAVRRFLAWIDYHAPAQRGGAGRSGGAQRPMTAYEIATERGSAGAGPPPCVFHTFAFLLDDRGGTLGSLDPGERILAYREVLPEELDAVGARLEAVTSRPSREIGGDWADWGRFRAVVHRAVARALNVP